MPSAAPTSRSLRWLSFAQFSALAVWLAWLVLPGPVTPNLGVWVVLVAPVVFGLLFVGSLVVLFRAPTARGLLPWLGLCLVSVALFLHGLFLYAMATWSVGF